MAPGNILLLGEYAVTETGAPGIALGIPREARATLHANETPRIAGRMGTQRFAWTPKQCNSPLLDVLVRECGEPRGSISVDTSAFAGPHGKLGLGSSAAAAVVISALLSYGDRPTGDVGHAERRRVFTVALAAHRTAQGGRGSGYDVATSIWGGIVRFSGGRSPAVVRYEPPVLPEFRLVVGGTSLATPAAVARYESWRTRDPTAAERFRSRSREVVEEFLAATDAVSCCAAIAAGGELLRWLGVRIGVTVEPPDLRDRLDAFRASGWAAKPVGAGGELGIAAAPEGTKVPDVPYAIPLRPASEGLRWLT